MNLLEKLDCKRRLDTVIEKNDKALLLPGDKVRLNYHRIKKDPTYKRKRMDWKMFVGRHQKDVFTVEYDPKYIDNPNVVCLTEDKHDPKWLWPVAYLIRVNENSHEKM